MFRVLTINTHKGFSTLNRRFALHELREAIRATQADLVFLQEVSGWHHRRAQRHADWPRDPHYEFLADSIWPEFAYGRNSVYTNGHHGNAILSHYPILRSEQVDISTNAIEQKGFLHSIVDYPDAPGPLHCLCVHLGVLGRSREKQMRLLSAYIGRRIPESEPVIVAGDFNDWRGRSHRAFARPLGFVETFRHTQGRTARTFPSWMPVLGLDRIYVRGLRTTRSTVCSRHVWSRLSDHLPLMAELTWDSDGVSERAA
ncbi:endonuclease/exonuclease/phosphatase family protein [Candidatus Sumerlaeota bacterium]|nr:endonuclease/exonuclease/phosphatase family protein [Candidatus Sumerlaeota bacterium]